MLIQIKTFCTYEIEVDNLDKAKVIYNSELWTESDLIDETKFEIGFINDNGEYQTIQG